MKIIIKKGEPLWSPEGYHILDENGFAVISEELYHEVYITNPDAIERVKKSLSRERWDEVYQLAINSTEMFLKDKQTELVLFEEEKLQLSQKIIDEENQKLQEDFVLKQKQLIAEIEKFDAEQKALQEAQEAEFQEILKQKKDEEAATIAKSEAEMAEVRKRSEAQIAERKKREAAEAEAEAQRKKAQEQLIADLLQRIESIEEKK